MPDTTQLEDDLRAAGYQKLAQADELQQTREGFVYADHA